MTPQDLRNEGVIDLGHVEGTAALYVRTRAGLHLQHVERVPTRRLDAWGVQRVLERYYDGEGLNAIADSLGVHVRLLRADLEAIGCSPTKREIAQRARTGPRNQRAGVATIVTDGDAP
jgi:hypothetical protein